MFAIRLLNNVASSASRNDRTLIITITICLSLIRATESRPTNVEEPSTESSANVVDDYDADAASVDFRGKLRAVEHQRNVDEMLELLQFSRPASNFAFSPYECPRVNGEVSHRLMCPTRRRHGYRVCVDESSLCNGRADCPNGEDEDPTSCMFYKVNWARMSCCKTAELRKIFSERFRRVQRDCRR